MVGEPRVCRSYMSTQKHQTAIGDEEMEVVATTSATTTTRTTRMAETTATKPAEIEMSTNGISTPNSKQSKNISIIRRATLTDAGVDRAPTRPSITDAVEYPPLNGAETVQSPVTWVQPNKRPREEIKTPPRTATEYAAQRTHEIKAGFLAALEAEMNKKKLSNPARNALAKHFDEMEEVVYGLISENAALRGRLQERRELQECLQKIAANKSENKTYVEVAKTKTNLNTTIHRKEGQKEKEGGREKKTRPQKVQKVVTSGASPSNKIDKPTKKKMTIRKTFAAIIKAPNTVKEGAEAAKETEEILRRAIRPSEDGILINRMRSTTNGKVVIEARSQADLDKIINNTTIKELGLVAATPALSSPRVIIYDLPRDMTEDQIKDVILKMNEKTLEGIDRELFKRSTNFKFKTGKRSELVDNWVVETSPIIFDKLVAAGRIYVEWQRCRVQPFTSLSRCYKCQGLGHIAKTCTAKVDTCGHCSEEGHRMKECTKKEEKPKCALCARRGRPSEHSVMDKSCPIYKLALKTSNSRVLRTADVQK